jgi:hypothetical protein
MLFKKMEQTKHGRIQENGDDKYAVLEVTLRQPQE